jgi:tetratricopeptide (TPR) repeat protein
MSLLLDALKKAEKAKEEAQRQSKGESAEPGGLRLQEDPAPPKAVTTRAELPDISAPLEILSDDLSPKGAAPLGAKGAEPRGERAAARAVSALPGAGAARSASQSSARAAPAERAAAKNVFEAKFKEPNPRLPFFITLGALGVFAVGTVVYFYLQLRPPQPLIAASPPPRAAASAAAPAAAPRPALQPAPQAQSAIPGLPSATGASPTPAVPRTQVQPAPAASAAAPREPVKPVASLPALRAPATQFAASPEVAARAAPPQIHPKVESAYAAYQAGDLEAARTDYQQALRDDAGNRDALLGLAAVDMRAGRFESAEAIYVRMLRAAPRDPHAQAGLIALRGARQDPTVTESRLKTLLASDPAAHVLNFTLGNQLAQQGRWAEAQQQYFKAFAGDPENADFAYNLAVSLDHLRQPRLALEYYQRALALAAKRGGNFDPAAAKARAGQLAN